KDGYQATGKVELARYISAAAAAPSNSELRETSIAAAVCWSDLFGHLRLPQRPGIRLRPRPGAGAARQRLLHTAGIREPPVEFLFQAGQNDLLQVSGDLRSQLRRWDDRIGDVRGDRLHGAGPHKGRLTRQQVIPQGTQAVEVSRR